MKKCIFLDRDGVIIEDKGYIRCIKGVIFLDGIGEFIRALNENGFQVIVVTNQSGIARGYFSFIDVNKINQYIQRNLLQYSGALIRDFYVCPHHIQGTVKEYTRHCQCRKPNPGMLLIAQKDYNLDFDHTYLIGDKESDVQAGERAGIRKSYLISKGNNLAEVLYDILQLEQDTPWKC